MNWADWVIVAILAVSTLISLKRGFIKEALSLATWGGSFFIALTFYQRLAVYLEGSVTTPSVRFVVAFVLLLVASLIAGALINFAINQLVKATGLSGTDRVLGMVFGLFRGCIIVLAVLIILPMAIPVDQDPWWVESVLIPQFLLLEQWSKDTFNSIFEFSKALI